MPNIKKEVWEEKQAYIQRLVNDASAMRLTIKYLREKDEELRPVLREVFALIYPDMTIDRIAELDLWDLKERVVSGFKGMKEREAAQKQRNHLQQLRIDELEQRLAKEIQPLKDRIVELVMEGKK